MKMMLLPILKSHTVTLLLVNNRYAIQKIIPDLEIIRPTIEEIMLFYAKGVNKTC